MAWVSKFSGLPTLTDIPDAADSYGAGVFSIDTLTSANNRAWTGAGDRFAPRAYVDLATIGASISAVLRVTGRCSAFNIPTELNSRRGIALYGPGADDACEAWIEEPVPAPSPSPGLGYGAVNENGTFTTVAGAVPLADCAVPNQLRLYWNGTGSAFIIPDAGFGSWSIAANTVSYWFSEDDGTTWTRVGDRAIAGGVAPTRACLWAGIDAAIGEVLTHTFTNLEVMEEGGAPPPVAKGPDSILDNDFSGPTVPYTALAGTGAFTIVSGKLHLNIPAGQNGDWWTFGRNSEALEANLGPILGKYSKIYAECEFSAFSANTFNEMYFNLYKGDVDWYQIFLTSGGTNLNARRMVSATPTDYASIAAPSLPFKVRLVWDVFDRTIEMQYDTGGGWTVLQAAIDIGGFVPTSVLFGGKNWSSLPVLDAEWDNLLVTGDPIDLVQNVDGAYQDEGKILDLGGPPAHATGIGAGQRLPGPVDQPTGSVGPFPFGSYQDQAEVFRQDQVDGGFIKQFEPSDAGAYQDEALVAGDAVEPGFDFAQVKLTGEPAHQQPQKGAFFDALFRALSTLTDFEPGTPTTDVDGHEHFLFPKVHLARFYRTVGEPWADPTSNNFSGYARDGTKYTNGVQDVGPVQAPWSAEPQSQDRSTRGSFPILALVVATEEEVIIFDLDQFNSSGELTMWMRFKVNSGFSMIGRAASSITDLQMINGTLFLVSLYNGIENGRLFSINFKNDGAQEAANLIGATNHWKLNPGIDITDRNTPGVYTTTGVSPSLRINNEQSWSLAVWQDPNDITRQIAVVGGDDSMQMVEYFNAVPATSVEEFPRPSAPANIGDIRNVCIGHDGWLWQARQQYLWRNLFDYQYGLLPCPLDASRGDSHRHYALRKRIQHIKLPYEINSIASARGFVYCATDYGIYVVDKVTLRWWLCYTIAGGGGRGRLDKDPPNGEVIPGEIPAVDYLDVINTSTASFLFVATKWVSGGALVVRLHDDVVIQSFTYPTLDEAGAYFVRGFTVVPA